MKKYSITKKMAAMVFAALALTACNNAEYSVLTNQAFWDDTKTNGNTSIRLTVGEDVVEQPIIVRLSSPAQQTSTFEAVVDEAALAEYNQRNSTKYVALPSSLYELSNTEATVEAGEITSTPVKITVKTFPDSIKESGKKYALALKLKSKNGVNEVLESGSKILFVMAQVVRQDVPVINYASRITFNMRKEYALTSWTVEMNVNIDQLGTEIGELNNQMLFGGWAPSGKEGEIYTRFGDAAIEGNRLQIKTQGSQLNSKQLFKTNTWYHLAFVCEGTKLSIYVNGKLDSSMDLPGKVVNLSNIMRFASATHFVSNVKVSELRLWTKARTQNEIINDMYECDPSSDGLEAYWKMNEGSGDTFKDATGHGNEGKATTVPTWIHNVRIDGK